MYDIQIINKEKDDKMTVLLKEELQKVSIDPFKLTTLVEMGADGFAKLKNNVSTLKIAAENRWHTVISSILRTANESEAACIWDVFEWSNKMNDDEALMIFLNSKKLNISRKENKRITALMLAAKYNNLKFAKECLKLKANMHAVDQHNLSVLDYANQSNNQGMVAFIEHVIEKDNKRREKQREKLKVNN